MKGQRFSRAAVLFMRSPEPQEKAADLPISNQTNFFSFVSERQGRAESPSLPFLIGSGRKKEKGY